MNWRTDTEIAALLMTYGELHDTAHMHATVIGDAHTHAHPTVVPPTVTASSTLIVHISNLGLWLF